MLVCEDFEVQVVVRLSQLQKCDELSNQGGWGASLHDCRPADAGATGVISRDA
jgi:hypothetical protein